ncbi:prepilin-type N-terminal cleavage/methylation domain-containing protein [Tundrisphaera sp. TA3]|uniref:prepilin-type N-terminal cleavage/methylation domain-containing protein n=1 Tax=Tundrisphaera sp. TA3 TaxID=3435775 RepID=UPI003EB82B94
MHATPRPASRGFTLIELLVVIAIIGLVSAVALPVVLPALNERKIGEAARLVQAVLAGARDNAVRAGAPRGVRFLPDPIFAGGAGQPLASNRMVAIEPGPDYSEGKVRTPSDPTYSFATTVTDPAHYVEEPPSTPTTVATNYYLRVSTSPMSKLLITNPPTGWSYNLRQGDKIRFNSSGNYYTIAGPIAPPKPYSGAAGASYVNDSNKERFIICKPGSSLIATSSNLSTWRGEYLNLTNGIDDDGDGWIDEACDGIDNDGDGITDPLFNGIDDNNNGFVDEIEERLIGDEYEVEKFVGTQVSLPPFDDDYTVYRRPVVSPGARETFLPDGIVIDLTTWNAANSTPSADSRPLLPERSRLPVDPYTGYVDVMIEPSGRVIVPGAGQGGSLAKSPIANYPFYHFWLTEREGVNAPLWEPPSPGAILKNNPRLKSTTNPQSFLLPMPKGTRGSFNPALPSDYEPMVDNPNNLAQAYSSNPVFLTGNRRLVTLFTRTGQIMTNSIESFDANDINAPYYAAQTGIKEPQ